MSIDCTTPGCRKQLPPTTLIQSNLVQLTQAVSTDCARNIVYLTDDPGFVDSADTLSGDYLNTTDSRFQVISSFNQTADHWLECQAGTPAIKSAAYKDLSYFFQLSRNAGSSPGYIIAVYWDRANETIAEALDALYECFRCFRVVTTASALSDGTAFYDTSNQLDIQAWTQTNAKVYVGLTFDQTLATSFTETASIPAQSNALSYDNSHFIWAGERCVNETGDDCVDTGNSVVEITPTDLAYAAVLASYPTSGTTYIPDPFLKPVNGIPGQNTADLSPSETINVTGVDINQGGQISEATRYTNVYHNIAGRASGFLYGDTVTGFKSYDIMQALYIQEELNGLIIDFLNTQSPVGISDAALGGLENLLITAARRYTNQGIITTDKKEFDLTSEYIVIDQGNGWILARQSISDLSLAELSQGFSPQYFFCYVNLRTLRFVRLTVCGLLKPEQISGVI